MELVGHTHFHLEKKGCCFAFLRQEKISVSGKSIYFYKKGNFCSYNGKTYVDHSDSLFDHGLTTLGTIDNKVLTVGGASPSNNEVEILEFDTNTWTAKTEYPYCSTR